MTGINPRDVFAIVAGTPPLWPQEKRCSTAEADPVAVVQVKAANARAEAILADFMFNLTLIQYHRQSSTSIIAFAKSPPPHLTVKEQREFPQLFEKLKSQELKFEAR